MPNTKLLLMGGMLWAGAACAQPALPADAPGPTVVTSQDCPPAQPIRPPYFPPAMVREGRNGVVVLDLEVDACGRVTRASIQKKSRKEFDEAALGSVRDASLSAEQLTKVKDGHFQLEVAFQKPRNDIKPQRIDWPTTHGSPRYVVDDEPIGYSKASEANDAIQDPDGRMWMPPYMVNGSRFVQVGEPGHREFWYFLSVDRVPKLAVRYRPMMQEGEAVVRLAMICEDTEESCAKTRAVFMQGLPFAKARRDTR